VKNKKNCYDIKIIHQYIADIWILIKISLHKNVGKVGTNFHLQRLHIPSSYQLSLSVITRSHKKAKW